MAETRINLRITGMHCAACSSRIERVIGKLEGVISINVSLPTNRASLLVKDTGSLDETLKKIVLKIQKLGFGATIDNDEDLVQSWQKRL